MNTILTLIALLFNSSFVCTTVSLRGEQKEEKETLLTDRRFYKNDLTKNLLKLKKRKILDNKTVVYLIPRSKKEWTIYYSFSRKDQNLREAFNELDGMFSKCANNNYYNAFILYLNISQFIDNKPFAHGDYYNIYYRDIDYTIEKQENLFCKMYPKFGAVMKHNFETYYDIDCK